MLIESWPASDSDDVVGSDTLRFLLSVYVGDQQDHFLMEGGESCISHQLR